MRTIASITTPPTIGRVAEPRPQTRIVDARTAPARPVVLSVARCGAGMRCGPQTQDPVGAVRQAASVAPLLKPAPGTVVRARDLAKLDPQTRIVPRHVAQAQANAATVAGMPQGYRPVWNDDRLNPRRAQGTVAGKAAMDLVWTNTVPRRLIDRNSGRDMTAYNPNLQYPYTELTEQVRAGNRTQQAPTISTRATPKPPASARAAAQPAAAPKAARVAGRFVQVGAFGDPANANRVVGRLQAAGLPVSIQRSSSKGKPVQVILAGPFGDPASTAHALDRARAAGFRDAFARN